MQRANSDTSSGVVFLAGKSVVIKVVSYKVSR